MHGSTVLVPLDGSATARAAVPYAAALARAFAGDLRLLGVVERRPDGSDLPAVPQDAPEATRYEGLTADLAEQATVLRGQGWQVSTDLVFGDPVEEILAAADAADVALTALATHGRGGFQRLLVGSVADKVMRLNRHPTLLVGSAAPLPALGALAITGVIVPLDGSALAETALPVAVPLAGRLGATLSLLRVEAPASVGAAADGSAVDSHRLDGEHVTSARSYLQEQQRHLGQSPPSEVMVLRGNAAEALADYVRSSPGSLVVMATHGRGGFRRFILGSTADRLVRFGVPVVLVHPSGQATAPAIAVAFAMHCAKCGRLITTVPTMAARCPRCQTHLHTCANCAFYERDSTGCVLQRVEAHQPVWPGRDCPRFLFRSSPS